MLYFLLTLSALLLYVIIKAIGQLEELTKNHASLLGEFMSDQTLQNARFVDHQERIETQLYHIQGVLQEIEAQNTDINKNHSMSLDALALELRKTTDELASLQSSMRY